MKIKTDEKGVTSCELSTQDKRTLAAAKTIIEKVAFHQRDDEDGHGYVALATDLGAFLKRMDGGREEDKTPDA